MQLAYSTVYVDLTREPTDNNQAKIKKIRINENFLQRDKVKISFWI